MSSRRRLGVLGGTFDPIHHGHLFAAEEVADALGLDQVLLVPCGKAAHKDSAVITAAEHRYAMCALAAEGNPRLAVSRIEIDRPGPSYAYDTVSALLQQPSLGSLYYIIGSDSFALIETWYRYAELLRLCRFAVVRRPGGESLGDLTQRVPGAQVQHLDIAGLEVSASDIRKRIRLGRSVKYLVPESVERYLRARGLYR